MTVLVEKQAKHKNNDYVISLQWPVPEAKDKFKSQIIEFNINSYSYAGFL